MARRHRRDPPCREHHEHRSIETDPNHEKWLDEIVTLAEGAALRKVSVDTLRREARRGTVEIWRPAHAVAASPAARL
jgi:hypothetical protein